MMKLNQQGRALVALGLILCTAWPGQADAQMAPEKVIRARQSSYFLMGQQMAHISATVKGDLAFDKVSLQLSAEALDVLDRLVENSYPPGSDQGTTRAKPDIWKEMARFKQLAHESQVEVGKLKEAINRGDLAVIKSAYGNASKSCKNCHDAFKAQ